MRDLLAAVLPRLEGIEGAIRTVFLCKGELLVLSDRALEAAFELLSEGTRLAGARLAIEAIGARVRCSACGYEGEAERLSDEGFHASVPILSCPKCQGAVEIQAGKELVVDRVEVLSPEASSPVLRGSQGAGGD